MSVFKCQDRPIFAFPKCFSSVFWHARSHAFRLSYFLSLFIFIVFVELDRLWTPKGEVARPLRGREAFSSLTCKYNTRTPVAFTYWLCKTLTTPSILTGLLTSPWKCLRSSPELRFPRIRVADRKSKPRNFEAIFLFSEVSYLRASFFFHAFNSPQGADVYEPQRRLTTAPGVV